MKTRICYQEGVSKGQPMPLTEKKWNELLDSAQVKDICARIAALDVNAADYNERKQALKKRLPVILPHASGFKNGKRVSADAVASGLAMLDVDHVEDPRDFPDRFAERAKTAGADRPSYGLTDFFKENGIVLVAITASGCGLRIIGERAHGESIEAAQMRMAEVLGIREYDAVTKDLARASFVVPREYILWMDEEHLLMNEQGTDAIDRKSGQSDCPVKEERLALPAHVEESHGDDGGKYATEREEAGPALDAGIMDGELCYRGIPYSEIVEQLLVSTGNGGGAEVGERNTVYFTLACYMRYICDFDSGLLLHVLPDFGLSEQERKQAIASAIGRPRKSEMPMVLQGAIAVVERDRCAVGRETATAVRSETLALPELPRLLKLICRRLPEEYRAAMVIASLPVLGTLATRVRFDYLDKQEQSLSFFSCITAPAASGKSFIRKPVDLLLTPINEQDAIEREKELAYKEKLRASKNAKNQPEDPHACPRNNGVSISIAKLLQLLTYAEGKHLIGIGEEMDTLVKSERAGVWSQKSDIYRLAFDNAEYGQAYMSDSSFNAHIRVYYNLLLTGTPNSMKRFFKDLENGLATRVAFAQLPDTSFTEIPVFAPYTEAEKAEIVRWARQLYAIGNRVAPMPLGGIKATDASALPTTTSVVSGTPLNASGGQVVKISCPQVGAVIGEWLEKKRQQAIDADSHAMDTLRRRAAVIGFRAGMLCYLLEDGKWSKTVGAFAEWVAEYVFRNQMELWGDEMEQLLTGALDAQTERGAASSLLALLPQEFTTGDLIKLRARKGQSVGRSAISMVLNRWKNTRRIEPCGNKTFRKL